MIRRLAVALLLSLSVAALPAGAQDRSVRFEIVSVTDTSLTFRVGTAQWVKSGKEGVSVDPRRRDALIARFRVTDVRSGQATAVVLGQTSPLSVDHTAVLAEPEVRSWQRRSFWGALLIGIAAGLGIGVAL